MLYDKLFYNWECPLHIFQIYGQKIGTIDIHRIKNEFVNFT